MLDLEWTQSNGPPYPHVILLNDEDGPWALITLQLTTEGRDLALKLSHMFASIAQDIEAACAIEATCALPEPASCVPNPVSDQ